MSFVFKLTSLLGFMLIIQGVFIFANVISTGRGFEIGDLRFPKDADTGFFLIVVGMILFGLSFFLDGIFRK